MGVKKLVQTSKPKIYQFFEILVPLKWKEIILLSIPSPNFRYKDTCKVYHKTCFRYFCQGEHPYTHIKRHTFVVFAGNCYSKVYQDANFVTLKLSPPPPPPPQHFMTWITFSGKWQACVYITITVVAFFQESLTLFRPGESLGFKVSKVFVCNSWSFSAKSLKLVTFPKIYQESGET